jgi:hypothetical protein
VTGPTGPTGPTAVQTASFTAARTRSGVRLHWRTGTDVDSLGFNIYRQHGHRRTRVNRRLIGARGAVSGSRYTYLDRAAPKTPHLRYWLEEIFTHGGRAWSGPATL